MGVHTYYTYMYIQREVFIYKEVFIYIRTNICVYIYMCQVYSYMRPFLACLFQENNKPPPFWGRREELATKTLAGLLKFCQHKTDNMKRFGVDILYQPRIP